MKKVIAFIITILVYNAKAQNFAPNSFSPDGFPFTVSFPAKIEKSVKPSANDTLLMAYSTQSAITYVISVSKTKSTDVASRSLPGIVKRLELKAAKVDLKKDAVLLNYTTSKLNYLNDKGSFIIIHVFSVGRYIIQLYTLSKGAYLDESQTAVFFNTFKFDVSDSNNSSANVVVKSGEISEATTSQTNNSQTNTGFSSWNVNDRAEIYDVKEKKWFGCLILKVNGNGTCKIGYDGYGDTYDEEVAADRLNKPTSNTTPAFPAYIKAVKGQRITVKGNLSSGQLMEDFEWAELSSMACWVGIRNIEFEGKHVAYWFDLPKKSIVKITVTPASANSRINIYGYSGFDFVKTPPNVSRCTSCEASFPEWIGQPDLSEPSKPQTIEFNATTIRNRVYFAVAGAKNVLIGDYTITIDMQ